MLRPLLLQERIGPARCHRWGKLLHPVARRTVEIPSLASNTVDMRFNPLPFVFAPGIGLVGYLVGDVAGSESAVAAWLLVTAAASVWALARGPVETADGSMRER